MTPAADTLVHLGHHAGFEDALRACRKIMMAYLWAFPMLTIVYFLAKPGFSGAFLAWILIATVAVLGLLKLARFVIKVELVMDQERQQLLLRRTIFGFTQLISLAGVEELWAVVTAGEVPAAPVNYWWDYVTLLITRSGQRFRAASHGVDFKLAEGKTRHLGERLGLPILHSEEGHKVTVTPGQETPQVRLKRFPLKAADCLAAFFWGFLIFITPVLAATLLAS